MSENRAHSRFGGSSASRWMNCAGSVALCETVPEPPEGPYAAEGSCAHKVAELSLSQRLHPTHWLGESFYGCEVTQEMCDAVVAYLNVVETEVAGSRTAELYVEKGFVLDLEGAENGEVFGTNDAMVYHPERARLRVFDYKHGVGVSVSAEDNAQLKFYAAGAVFGHPDWKIGEVVLTIVQPRARDNDSPADAVRDWTFQVTDLLDFVVEAETAIQAAKKVHFGANRDPDSTYGLATGSWCRWCRAAAICPLREKEALEAATLDFQDITLVDITDLPDPRDLDVERLAAVVKGLDLVSSWMGQCREHLEALVLNGAEVPGWKAVEKIGRAKWIEDPQKVAEDAMLSWGLDEDQIMPRKLVTIGEAEKLLKAAGADKDALDDFKLKYTFKESSGLTVAQASDRRPAVPVGASEFGSVNIEAA